MWTRGSQGMPRKRMGHEGFALEATLAVLVLMSVLVITVYGSAMAAFRSGTTDLNKQRAYYASEAGAESAMAQLADALEDAVLEEQELDMIVSPTMSGFSFDSFSVVKVDTVRHERITDGPFTGLYSLTQLVEIFAEASGPSGSSSGVVVTAKAQAIPIFQFGVFFEKDLEIHNGPRLDFAGWVHTNGNLYLSSNNQYFEDLVTTPGSVFHDRKDRHESLNGVYIQDAASNDVQLDFDSRDTPDFGAFRNKSDTDFDNRLKTAAHDVDTLRVPLPDGMDPIEVMRPRRVSDGALEIQARMAWKADWYIEVPMDQLGNPADLCDEMISVRDTTKTLPSSSACDNIFTLEYDAFYDAHEGRFVDAFSIEMDELFSWTGTDDTKTTRIIYVYFTGTSPDPEGDGDYPVVRLHDGATLGNAITVATKHPLYVQGNYNTGGWRPAGLIGDAFTVLSSNWSDGANQGPGMENAGNTSIYAAVLAGHTPTPCDHEMTGCGSTSPYGGGLENFPRFLESWSGRTLLYRGSLVSLSFAEQATVPWSYGSYYTAPGRDWAFDTRFEDPANLPPGTPVVGNVIHTAFRPVY